MLKSNVLVFVIALGMFALVHLLLIHTYLYWRYPEVDIPMHFLGGTIVALGIFAARDLNIPFFASLTRFIPTLAFVLLIAVIWEVFQYMSGISTMKVNFWSDTIGDVIFGVAGGLVGFFVAHSIAKLDHDHS